MEMEKVKEIIEKIKENEKPDNIGNVEKLSELCDILESDDNRLLKSEVEFLVSMTDKYSNDVEVFGVDDAVELDDTVSEFKKFVNDLYSEDLYDNLNDEIETINESINSLDGELAEVEQTLNELIEQNNGMSVEESIENLKTIIASKRTYCAGDNKIEELDDDLEKITSDNISENDLYELNQKYMYDLLELKLKKNKDDLESKINSSNISLSKDEWIEELKEEFHKEKAKIPAGIMKRELGEKRNKLEELESRINNENLTDDDLEKIKDDYIEIISSEGNHVSKEELPKYIMENKLKEINCNLDKIDERNEKIEKINEKSEKKEKLEKRLNFNNKRKKDNKKRYKVIAALAGGALGFGMAMFIQPGTVPGLVISTGRLVYSAVKVYTKRYASEDSKIKKVIDVVNNKKNDWLEKHASIAKGLEKVNEVLKKPSTQWFLNGMAVGYTVGKITKMTGILDKTTSKNVTTKKVNTTKEAIGVDDISDNEIKSNVEKVATKSTKDVKIPKKVKVDQVWNVKGLNDGYGFDSSTMDKKVHLNQELCKKVTVAKTKMVEGIKMVLVKDNKTKEVLGWFKAKDILKQATYIKTR